MSSEPLMYGAGGAVIGLLVGFLAGGVDERDLAREVASRVKVDEVAAAQAEQIDAVNAKIDALEATLAGLDEGQNETAAKVEEAVGTLSGQMEEVAMSVREEIASTGEVQSSALGAMITAEMAKLSDTLEGTVAAVEAPATTEEAAAPAEAEVEVEIDGVRVGQTEWLMDGAARVFVSGIDEDAGTARVAVNGLGLAVLGSHEDVTFDHDGKTCTLILDGIVEGHVQVSAECE